MTLDTVIAAGGRVYRAVMHVPTGLATAYLVMFVSPVLGRYWRTDFSSMRKTRIDTSTIKHGKTYMGMRLGFCLVG